VFWHKRMSGKKQQQQQRGKNVFFFDYDDTILCSSYLSKLGIRVNGEKGIPEDVRAHLSDLEKACIQVVQAAQRAGDVFCVTNAEVPWVEMSCKVFISALAVHLCI
jgi:hypothetical protein